MPVPTYDQSIEPELRLAYPAEWEAEYKRRGFVRQWLRDYPTLFQASINHSAHPGRLSSRIGTLDLFAQYALQYRLRERGIRSITWYKIASTSARAKDRHRTVAHWRTMGAKMGADRFALLQEAIIERGFSNIAGEPDLFCWTTHGDWFFAEAKRADRLGDRQKAWFQVCRKALGGRADIRVYRLVRSST